MSRIIGLIGSQVLPYWPNFEYHLTEKTEQLIFQYIKDASHLQGQLSLMESEIKSDALIDIMVSEAIKTSAIEGVYFDDADVRSSIRHQLGMSKRQESIKDPKVSSLAHLMIDVRKTYQEPLTKEKLFEWQQLLTSDPKLNIGKWRESLTPMQVVSGYYGHHFEAPPSKDIPKEMEQFIKWFNNTSNMKGPVKSAIAHLYFETIHPFDDGNGRVGRAISEKALSEDFKTPVLLSLSNILHQKKNLYYQELTKASCYNLDITNWIEYFVETIYQAQVHSRKNIVFVLQKAKFFTMHEKSLNERQMHVVKRMFDEGVDGFKGGINAKK